MLHSLPPLSLCHTHCCLTFPPTLNDQSRNVCARVRVYVWCTEICYSTKSEMALSTSNPLRHRPRIFILFMSAVCLNITPCGRCCYCCCCCCWCFQVSSKAFTSMIMSNTNTLTHNLSFVRQTTSFHPHRSSLTNWTFRNILFVFFSSSPCSFTFTHYFSHPSQSLSHSLFRRVLRFDVAYAQLHCQTCIHTKIENVPVG